MSNRDAFSKYEDATQQALLQKRLQNWQHWHNEAAGRHVVLRQDFEDYVFAVYNEEDRYDGGSGHCTVYTAGDIIDY